MFPYLNQALAKKIIISAYFAFIISYCQAQDARNKFLSIQSAIDTIRTKLPAEKIYLQFDKNAYISGDTMWFKAYLFNASYLTPSKQSGILYIDIANDDSVVVKQFRVPVASGVIWGNIDFNKQDFKEGNYTMRAYTSWLRNFSQDHFFYHHFTILGSDENNWLVTTRVQSFNANGNDSVRATLQFNTLAKQAVADKPLSLRVMAGKKTFYKAGITTSRSGASSVNFTLPGKPLQATLVAEDNVSSKQMIIPLLLARPENIDLQFMPEGGELIAGLPAHVGFKAIGEDGRSADVKGVIVNSHNQQVTSFQSLHKGMGSFNMLPAAGEIYSAKVSLPGGIEKTFALPVVQQAGIVLQINNKRGEDSVELAIYITPGFFPAGSELLLAGQARNVVCYAAALKPENNYLKRSIGKDLFPAGIARFTLFNAAGEPLKERLAFIDDDDSLNIDLNTNSNYYPRDSIPVEISVKDDNGLPVRANFSLAVTDDEQVKTNALSQQNIVSYTYLSSDLKGYVEEPGYYFNTADSIAWQALDNLLLTQGWAGYEWQQVFNPLPTRFLPEHEFMVKGKVSNVFNKGVSRAKIVLLSKNPLLAMDTIAGEDGGFVFRNFPSLDTPQFIIQAKTKHDKSFNVGIDITEAQQPRFSMPPWVPELPWYINSDTTLLALAQQKIENDKHLFEGLTLQNVTVTAVKKVEDSQNLNGSGSADQVLDGSDMEKSGKKSLLELLQETVKGFHSISAPPCYLIKEKLMRLIVDGTDVNMFFQPPPPEENEVYRPDQFFQFMKSYLDHFNAEEIKGMEVIYSPKYTVAYDNRYSRGMPPVFAYVEITTRSGKGPFLEITPGVYHYNGLPFSWPKKFYSPRYPVNDTSDHSLDARSTIFWEPNIITGVDGKATLSFYAADKPTTYTLIIEGTDFNGRVAVKTKKIVVQAKK